MTCRNRSEDGVSTVERRGSCCSRGKARPLVCSLASGILVSLLVSGCVSSRGQRYLHFSTPTPIERNETLIMGFMGGRDSWDNADVGVGRLAGRLRALGLPGVHVETVENSKRDIAVQLVRNSFDRNRDGTLNAMERDSSQLIVYGQSFGGAAVVKFARQMDALEVPILLTLQVDSVGIGDAVIPPNVRAAANLFQKNGLIIRGEPAIREEDSTRTTILGNFQFDYANKDIDLSGLSWFKKIGRVAHTKMDRDPEVWSLVEQLILDTVSANSDAPVINLR